MVVGTCQEPIITKLHAMHENIDIIWQKQVKIGNKYTGMSSISRTYGELLFIVDEILRDEPTGAILKVWKKNNFIKGPWYERAYDNYKYSVKG